MERESFRDSDIARLLNRYFISIKVDREERPDIDNVYMSVCQSLCGDGGWPLNLFLTPSQKPFFAGTYFPKQDSRGSIGLTTLIENVHNAWESNRESLAETAGRVTERLNRMDHLPSREITEEDAHSALQILKSSFDARFGGFGQAPKFPMPHICMFLLEYYKRYDSHDALMLAESTLNAIYRGGIHDHIGGGYCRYSTDEKWLIPHFEKMLYDNALIAYVFLQAAEASGNDFYLDAASETLDFILRDLTGGQGGFFSTISAESGGSEGEFYVWTPTQIAECLGGDAGEFCRRYGITQRGNFEGKSIPHLSESDASGSVRPDASGSVRPDASGSVRPDASGNVRPDASGSVRPDARVSVLIEKLRQERDKRERPPVDDKILTAWNGLAIAAFARAGRATGNPAYTRAAERAIMFIEERLTRPDGRLLARYRDGESAFLGYVDDYAFLTWGLLELYETTGGQQHLIHAFTLARDAVRLFDDNGKGLFFYGEDAENLIARTKEIYDGAIPSGNAIAAWNFKRLGLLADKLPADMTASAQQIFSAFGSAVSDYPAGHTALLYAWLFT